MKSALVVTIGNEIVSGDVENTNASWLARRLAQLGVGGRVLAPLAGPGRARGGAPPARGGRRRPPSAGGARAGWGAGGARTRGGGAPLHNPLGGAPGFVVGN